MVENIGVFDGQIAVLGVTPQKAKLASKAPLILLARMAVFCAIRDWFGQIPPYNRPLRQ